MQVQIQFIAHGACSALGAFSPGGIARVSQALADHLVTEMKAAKYVQAQGQGSEKQEEKSEQKPAAKPRKQKD